MKILIKLILISIITVSILLTGCDDTSDDPLSSGGPYDGGGSNGTYVSDTAPDTSISLPTGVSVTGLDGDITHGNTTFQVSQLYKECIAECSLFGIDMDCVMGCVDDAVSDKATKGIGAFYVSIQITNENITSETVKINAGAVLTPRSRNYQPMMLIQDIYLRIGPEDKKDFLLPVYCLNPSLSPPPPDSTKKYTISEITRDPCLKNIIEILTPINVNNFDFTDASTVQDSIWHCFRGVYDHGFMTQTTLMQYRLKRTPINQSSS